MDAGEIATVDVVTVEPDASATETALAMREAHVGCVIVAENGAGGAEPVGIVTDRDLAVLLIATDIDPDEVTAGDVMTGPPLTVAESDSVHEVIRLMSSHAVRRVPVVDGEGWLAGVIAVEDVMAVLTEELQALTDLLFEGQERERRLRP